jgi:hypothetical protein
MDHSTIGEKLFINMHSFVDKLFCAFMPNRSKERTLIYVRLTSIHMQLFHGLLES